MNRKKESRKDLGKRQTGDNGLYKDTKINRTMHYEWGCRWKTPLNVKNMEGGVL